jgi:N-sulfoglucosamine sulfohydrolase
MWETLIISIQLHIFYFNESKVILNMGSLPSRFTVYTDLLEAAGYLVGHEGKGWGPGDYESGGWTRNPVGDRYNSFEEFYNEKERGQPFCYWFISLDPHRPYKAEGWKELGADMDNMVVPTYLPAIRMLKKT